MTALARALLEALDDQALDELAAKLAPRLAGREPAPASDRWLRGADAIGAYIAAPRSRVYALASQRRIPLHRDGSTLLARTSELDAWLLAGGGRRA